MFAGEALEPQRLRTWLDNHPGSPRLINCTASTETTVHASFREIFPDDVGSPASPIGVPLAHLPSLCSTGGCAQCPPALSASCMWPARPRPTGIGGGRG